MIATTTAPKAAACATGCYKVNRNGQWICVRCGNWLAVPGRHSTCAVPTEADEGEGKRSALYRDLVCETLTIAHVRTTGGGADDHRQR